MFVNSIGSNMSFKGIKEIQTIEKQYAKTREDKELAAKAKEISANGLEITGDGIWMDDKTMHDMRSFLENATQAKNGKLAFLLAADLKKTFGLHNMAEHYARESMIQIAKESNGVTKEDVLNFLV